jgi:hypothetical protein
MMTGSDASRASFTVDGRCTAMRFEGKTKIEKAWLVAAVGVFVLHRLLEASSSGYHPSDPLRLWLELTMIVLSFPFGGLTLFALHAAACLVRRLPEFRVPVRLVNASLRRLHQWFWVLPEFLRSRKLTLLDLKQSTVAAAPSVPGIKESAAHASHERRRSTHIRRVNCAPAAHLRDTHATPPTPTAAKLDAAAKPRAFVAVPHRAFDAPPSRPRSRSLTKRA